MLSLASWLFQPLCAACARPSAAPLCAGCAAGLLANAVACPSCAEPLASARPARCLRCVTRPLPLERVIAPWQYGGPLADALVRLKFSRRVEVARALAPLVAPVLTAAIAASGATMLVPVPLHWTRRLSRGFDQCRLMLSHVASCAELAAAICPVLVRARRTPLQSRLSAGERAKNLAGAISVGRRWRAAVVGASIVLFDDVVTTGATMAACAQALVDAGAREVIGVALARASNK